MVIYKPASVSQAEFESQFDFSGKNWFKFAQNDKSNEVSEVFNKWETTAININWDLSCIIHVESSISYQSGKLVATAENNYSWVQDNYQNKQLAEKFATYSEKFGNVVNQTKKYLIWIARKILDDKLAMMLCPAGNLIIFNQFKAKSDIYKIGECIAYSPIKIDMELNSKNVLCL